MASGETHLPERIRTRSEALWEEAGRPEGGPEAFIRQARLEVREEERLYDKTVADSFPASDPPASSGITGATD